ncbi:MAG: 16S rRNA (cytidine(1402)-2'-O)-methyltransferase [Desulfovibrionales bacterium]
MHSTGQRLWVVATPLGNLGDLAPRAREVLERADLILAEDTRRAGLLLKRCGIVPQNMLSLFEHNEEQRITHVLTLLTQGREVALISDAGTPLIADPGYRLVRACRKAGIPVSPVPGPSAIMAALSVSGIPPYPFVFLGFLPRKSGDQKSALEPYALLGATLVLFERKSRVEQTLQTAHEILGKREFCLARELTKKHEQFIYGRLGDDPKDLSGLKGEITIVVGPPEQMLPTDKSELLVLLEKEMSRGGTPKEVSRRVRDKSIGWSSREIYAVLTELQDRSK